MAEGRIVMAGALADQGDFAAAIKLLVRVADAPKKIREYHLKQWYVLADLYDRSGDVVRGSELLQASGCGRSSLRRRGRTHQPARPSLASQTV